MQKTKLLIGLILSFSSNSWAENIPDTEQVIYNKLSTLIVSPYRFDEFSFNKRIYYGDNYKQACDYRADGYFNFVDLESDSIAHLELSSPLPTHAELLSKTEQETRNYVSNAAVDAREQCMDVILAPVIDYAIGERNLFQPRQAVQKHPSDFDLAKSRLEAISGTYVDNGLITTFKHYPISQWTPPDDKYRAQFDKTIKSPESLYRGYAEATPMALNDDEWFSDYDGVQGKVDDVISGLEQDRTMIMLSNYAIKEFGYKPYVFTSEPTKDSFLRNYKGLVITDDLYQLVITPESSLKAFENADLYIITSIEDIERFMRYVSDAARSDPAVLEKLNEKFNKVDSYFDKYKESMAQ